MSSTLAAFAAASAALTVAGGLAPFLQSRLSRKGLRRIFSLRSGILVSIAFMEILPEGLSLNPALAGGGALAGFVLLLGASSFFMTDCCPEYLEDCHVHLLGAGALAAVFLHAFIAGFNLTLSFAAGSVAGFAVGSATVLHKLADGFTLSSLLKQSGYGRAAVVGSLLAAASATPLGAAAGWWGYLGREAAWMPEATAALLGFCGGTFLYMGAADMLPRLHRSEDRWELAFFGAGLAAIMLLRTSP